jgi:hypothetical protein
MSAGAAASFPTMGRIKAAANVHGHGTTPDRRGWAVPPATAKPGRLARPLAIERHYDPNRETMLAALRVVLGLPRQIPDRGQGGAR